MKLWQECVLITVAGSTLGLVINAASPRGARLTVAVYPASASGATSCEAGPPVDDLKMPVAEAVAACIDCTVGFVDARGSSAFANGHIPGAFHLPPRGHDDEAAVVAALRRFGRVVVYDDETSCELARGVAARLRSAGLPDVRLLGGNWQTWQEAQGPAQSGACEACEQGHP